MIIIVHQAGQHAFYSTMHEGAKSPRASETKSMLPSLVYYNWLIVTNAQKKRRSFAIRNSPNFRTFRRERRLRLPRTARARGIALSSKKRKYSALLLRTAFDVSRSDDDFEELAKGFQPKAPRYQTAGP